MALALAAEVFIVSSGPYWLGFDAAAVLSIRPQSTGDGLTTYCLADFLGDGPVAAPRRGRLVALRAGAATVCLAVDAVHGVTSATPYDVAKLPPLLLRHGVPGWILGTMWRDTTLVLLCDAQALAGELQGTA